MIYRQEDMPYTEDGVVPDIIVNPHAIPSRMTIGQLMECILGKACVVNGDTFGDATPFNNMDIDTIANVLEKHGLDKHGNEVMYNGFTGEQMSMKIFIGPTFYQRLKHMTVDKVHSRSANGPVVLLTRRTGCLKAYVKPMLITGYGGNASKLRETPILNSELLSYVGNIVMVHVNRMKYSKNARIGTIRLQAPKSQRTRDMVKVQRLHRRGLEGLVRTR
jgi:hypothetical protein